MKLITFVANYVKIKKINLYIYLFFLFSLPLWSTEGNLVFEKISIEQGLSQSIILSITEDSFGFLWIGTEDGLNRYDGYEFTHFTHDRHNTNSISNNYIRSIAEDQNKCLWIATNGGGLDCYNLLTETFTHFTCNENRNSVSGNELTSLAIDSTGNIWIGTVNSGLNRLDRNRKTFEYYKNNSTDTNSLLNNHVTELLYDNSRNVLWVGTYEGLSLLDISTGKFHNLNKILFRQYTPENKRIRSLWLDRKSNLWIGTDTEGLLLMENINPQNEFSDIVVSQFKNNPADPFSISGNSINSVVETREGNIIVGVWGGGISRVVRDKASGRIKFLVSKKNYTDVSSLSGDDINVLYEDRSRVLWIGTYGEGLNKVSPYSDNFMHHSHNPNNHASLSDNRVFSIYEDNDNDLWIGTWGGLNYYDKKNDKFISYKHDSKNPYSISENRIYSIIQDNSGYLWIATIDHGLNRFDKKTGRFRQYGHTPDSESKIPTDRLLSLMKRTNGDIWLGTYSEGVTVYDARSDSFKPLEYDSKQSLELSDKRIKCMMEDGDNIWIGTYKGLNKYNLRNKSLEKFCNGDTDSLAIFNTGITVMNKSSDGSIWLGTFGNGLTRLIYSTEEQLYRVKEYHVKEGLPNEFIYSVIPDNEGNIWVSTKNGIARFDPVNEKFYNYGSYEGINFTEFREGFYYNSREDKIYMGSLDGYIEFVPSKLKAEYDAPRIVFTNLKLFNRIVTVNKNSPLKKSITDTDELVLNFNQNSLALEFTTLNFIAPNSTTYQYKLDGFDKEYFTTDTDHREITYTNLSPGKYVLRVKASLGAQQENISEKTLSIIIIPPFWQETWFVIFVLILIFAFIGGGYRWRTIAIRKRNIELQREVSLRTKELSEINLAKDRFFSVIAHDLKGPFSYLLNNSDLLVSELNTLPKEDVNSLVKNINSSANNLYNLLENLLEWSKYQMMGIKPQNSPVNLNELVENNIILYKYLSENKNIQFKNNINSTYILNTDSNIINTVIRNVFINAIKFTNVGGEIKVDIKDKKDFVVLEVADSGIGIDKATINEIYSSNLIASTSGTKNEKGTGLGLIMVREFVEALGGELKIESEIGKGTCIRCYLPR